MNIYLQLTKEFNQNRLRAIISSGQAVVLHRLAIMSKDGDWIMKEDKETTEHILKVLAEHGAKYRFGAPLDMEWLQQGWSSHFEFQYRGIRVRTDFVTRPPRVSIAQLEQLWMEQQGKEIPFVDIKTLIQIKETNREKDYAVIGELARMVKDPKDQLRYSRSAQDIIEISKKHPALIKKMQKERPLLKEIEKGRNKLEEALDAERRRLMHKNENRLEKYITTAQNWREAWPDIQAEIEGKELQESHQIIKTRAEKILPKQVKIK